MQTMLFLFSFSNVLLFSQRVSILQTFFLPPFLSCFIIVVFIVRIRRCGLEDPVIWVEAPIPIIVVVVVVIVVAACSVRA